MRKAAKENIVVVCTIALCFVLTLSLCAMFSGNGLLGVFSASESNGGTTVYAITVGGFSDMTLARATAEVIRQRGGAGYVIEGESIELIYAAYPDRESANGVLIALDESSAYIKEIEIADSKLKWADSDIKPAVKNALGYYDKAFETLYATANALNDNSISTDDARTQIRVLQVQIEDIKSVFYQSAADYDSEQITEIKLALITALALLENVKTESSVASFTSSVRYALVQLVLCRQALMNRI